MLGSDRNRHSLGHAVGVGELTLAADPLAREGLEPIEGESLLAFGVLHAGLAQVAQDHLDEGARLRFGLLSCRMGLLHTALSNEVGDYLKGSKDEAKTLADIEAAYNAAAKEGGYRMTPEQYVQDKAARSGSSTACHFSQMSSISGLLAIDFSVTCGTRL